MHNLLLTKEVADYLRVSEDHVRALIRKGIMRAYKEGQRGGYRIQRAEVERYVNRKSNNEKESMEHV